MSPLRPLNCVGFLVLTLSGCNLIAPAAAPRSLPSSATKAREARDKDLAELRAGTLQSVALTTRPSSEALCPGAKVQLAASASILVRSGQTRSVQTRDHVALSEWYGVMKAEDQAKTDAALDSGYDFSLFEVTSEQGTSEVDGIFTAEADARASAAHGFVIRVSSAHPGGASSALTLKPTYECVKSARLSGGDAAEGADAGSVACGHGRNGADSGRHQVAVTYVKTPFYPKLLAVRSVDDGNGMLTLARVDAPLRLLATGQAGGDGGSSSCSGQGGAGGRGGRGAELDIFVDARYPEIAKLIAADVAGGAGGAGGQPNGMPQGEPGDVGPNGHVTVSLAPVAKSFEGLDGISLLADPPVPADADSSRALTTKKPTTKKPKPKRSKKIVN